MKSVLSLALLCILSFGASAERSFYGTLSGGFVKNEIENYDMDRGSYKIGIGYELTPQWYLEAGYQALGEENAGESVQVGSDVAEFSGIYFSALGKARGQYGELFYRLGALRVDADVQTSDDLGCGESFCRIDDSLLAGVIGVGFDLYVHQTTMMRFEVEYIRGEQDYSASAAYVGVRVNF